MKEILCQLGQSIAQKKPIRYHWQNQRKICSSYYIVHGWGVGGEVNKAPIVAA